MSRWAHEHPDDPEMEGLMDRLDWHRDLPQDERPASPEADPVAMYREWALGMYLEWASGADSPDDEAKP